MNPITLVDLLACPKCRGALAEAKSGFVCGSCVLEFPAVGKIPWLHQDPAAKLVEWRHQLTVALEDFRRQEERLKAASRQPTLSDLGKKRLQKEIQARVEYRKAVETILEPLGTIDPGTVDLWRVLSGKNAFTQMLTSYAVNVIRDWGWPETDENARALELVQAVRGTRPSAPQLLVLGAGAGRLAYDVHQAQLAGATTTLDINPFLTFVADRMFAGKSLALQEFPLAPDGLANVAVARKLQAPEKARSGLTALFGDALKPPFAKGVFDEILTPWLIDILPEPPSRFLPRLNDLLKVGGLWINHGTCAFQLGAPEHHVSREELMQCVEDSGFKLLTSRQDRVPYLVSPASCNGRSELVLTFAAEKVRDVPLPAVHRSLPPFLDDPTRPVPRVDQVVQIQVTHTYHAEILSLVDGQRSAGQIADALAAKYQLNATDAKHAVVGFLAKQFDIITS